MVSGSHNQEWAKGTSPELPNAILPRHQNDGVQHTLLNIIDIFSLIFVYLHRLKHSIKSILFASYFCELCKNFDVKDILIDTFAYIEEVMMKPIGQKKPLSGNVGPKVRSGQSKQVITSSGLEHYWLSIFQRQIPNYSLPIMDLHRLIQIQALSVMTLSTISRSEIQSVIETK